MARNNPLSGEITYFTTVCFLSTDAVELATPARIGAAAAFAVSAALADAAALLLCRVRARE